MFRLRTLEPYLYIIYRADNRSRRSGFAISFAHTAQAFENRADHGREHWRPIGVETIADTGGYDGENYLYRIAFGGSVGGDS